MATCVHLQSSNEKLLAHVYTLLCELKSVVVLSPPSFFRATIIGHNNEEVVHFIICTIALRFVDFIPVKGVHKLGLPPFIY